MRFSLKRSMTSLYLRHIFLIVILFLPHTHRRRCPGTRVYPSRTYSLDDTRGCLWRRSRSRVVGSSRPGRTGPRHLHRPTFVATQCHWSTPGELLHLHWPGCGRQKTRSRLCSRFEFDVARIQNWTVSVMVGSQENCW
jgi:hypothetical protein